MPCNPPAYTPSGKKRSLPAVFSCLSETIIPLKKKMIKNSQNSISFLCVTDSFYRWAFRISKSSRDPWGMRNRKMQCHLQHGWLQRNRSLEHGCAINRMFALQQPSQMLWRTVLREIASSGAISQGSAVSGNMRDDVSGLTHL